MNLLKNEKKRVNRKSEEISLRAYQKGGNIVIEIEDDGQGLNRAKILAKARERKIISEENSLTDFQIDNLIFEPGFSTAEKITDVSGRGVGMDVVKRVIEKIRGKVEIYSVEGKRLSLCHPSPFDLGHYGRDFGQNRTRAFYHPDGNDKRNFKARSRRCLYGRKERRNDQGERILCCP